MNLILYLKVKNLIADAFHFGFFGDYTANVYRALGGLFRVSLLWGNHVTFTDCGEIL